jgi:hypothetical protein
MNEDLQLFLEDLLVFLEAEDGINARLESQIKKLLGEQRKDRTQLPFNIDAISWKDRTGEKGAFQLSEDVNNNDHKQLLAFLGQHAGGRITTKDSAGRSWFVWTFQNGATIGRKLAKTNLR